MNDTVASTAPVKDLDHLALLAACDSGVGLCTIVGIEGSFSRRLGAQLAVLPDGRTVGSVADRCLDAQLVADLRSLSSPVVRKYGTGSDNIDFRLPCGGGLDILLDPSPNRSECKRAAETLSNRKPARISLPSVSLLAMRQFIPGLKLRIFGEGDELVFLQRLALSMDIELEAVSTDELQLGKASGLVPADRYTAIVLLFHDHNWELALIEEALAGDAFFIGAQGGETACIRRSMDLLARGVDENAIARVQSPVGLIPACKSPDMLALSVLSEVMAKYERLRPSA